MYKWHDAIAGLVLAGWQYFVYARAEKEEAMGFLKNQAYKKIPAFSKKQGFFYFSQAARHNVEST